MKNSIFFAALTALLVASTSCDKNETDIKLSGVKSSTDACEISLAGTFNNLVAVTSDAQAVDVNVKTNVPVISYSDKEYVSGHGFQFVPEDLTDFEKTGTVPYVFHSGGNDEYTIDCGFQLIQSMWNREQTGFTDFWTDYTNYGLVETDVNFRVRGAKGERIIDFDDEKNWSAGNQYYLKGDVLSISEITEGVKDFEALPIYKPFFEKIGFQQTVTSYTTQACVLTVVCGDEIVDLQVYGKKRDNDIAKLLQNVSVGSTIEFPANVKDKAALAARNLEPVKTSTVLKLK